MRKYYNSRILEVGIAEAEKKVTEALRNAGFGILTEIDVSATLKKKIGVEFRPYKILGACNPKMAHQALQAEGRIGLMLPCNVILQDVGNGRTEVAAIDPEASMQAVGNPDLSAIAAEVGQSLRRVVDTL